ncbi:MAG: NAD(P)-binding protein [Gammaproteobacteria bacterium]|nr:NAD(P)-binding protein [Gammaproteobacteria bacterium]
MQASSSQVTTEVAKRVGIIGAGIAGLVTAKVLLAKGFEVVVFDKEVTLGGVWAVSRTYPGLKANNSKETYCFSDHSHADTVGHHPTADDVRELLESYADRFNIRSNIRFACEVSQLSESVDETKPGFQLKVKDIKSEESETLYFPYVVICNGAFSKASVPEIEGMENFSGEIRHSSHCMPEDLDNATSVLTVGAGKSALDCASSAALKDKKSTLVFRQAHWMAPRYFPGGGRSDLRMVSRFAELFVEYPHRTNSRSFYMDPACRW